jgi:hypothetical protein
VKESEVSRAVWLQGYLAGLRAFAWWRDGVQYVGTCGTTLRQAIERAWEKYGIQKTEDADDDHGDHVDRSWP